MRTESLLFALLRHAACGEELNEQMISACTPENLEAVYALAQKHDLAHLVAHAVESLTLPECDVLVKLKTAKKRAIYRYARMDYEYEQLCEILEKEQILFLPVKGVIIRTYYPEPWMRTSGDMDILVQEADLKRVTDVLSKQHWFIRGEINHHDVHMQTASGVHLDLHYSIRGNIDNTDAVLDRVWDYCTPAENKQYEYRQTNAFFLYHLLAHTSRHFLSEGCGIRPFLDWWILRQKMTWDAAALQKLCAEAQLETFCQCMTDLSDAWFDGKAHTAVTEKLGQYVVNRNKQTQIYNASLFKQARADQSAHWGSRLFLSYDLLKTTYPILEKHRWLLPVFQIVRWFRKLSDGRIRRFLLQRNTKPSIDAENIAEAKKFLRDIGLDA